MAEASEQWKLLRCVPDLLSPFHASVGQWHVYYTTLLSFAPSLFFTCPLIYGLLVSILCHPCLFLKSFFFFQYWQKLWGEEKLLIWSSATYLWLHPNQLAQMLPWGHSSVRSGLPGSVVWHLMAPLPEASKPLGTLEWYIRQVFVSPDRCLLLCVTKKNRFSVCCFTVLVGMYGHQWFIEWFRVAHEAQRPKYSCSLGEDRTQKPKAAGEISVALHAPASFSSQKKPILCFHAYLVGGRWPSGDLKYVC